MLRPVVVSGLLWLFTSGCAVFGALTGNLPQDVEWSTSLVSRPPTAPQYCFTTHAGAHEYDTCEATMRECVATQGRAAAGQGSWSSECAAVQTPFCFVYDVKNARQVFCSTTRDGCERDSARIGRGFFEPVVASSCGPLTGAPVAAAVAPVDLQAFLNDLDLGKLSATLSGDSNGTALKPVSGHLTRNADGTFFLRLTDLTSGGVSEFGIDLPAGLKTGQIVERKSTAVQSCGTVENQVFDPRFEAYRFNDAACSWRLELTSLPPLPKTNGKARQENVATVTGRVVLRLVQRAGSKPVTSVAPSWVGGSFQLPVHLAGAD